MLFKTAKYYRRYIINIETKQVVDIKHYNMTDIIISDHLDTLLYLITKKFDYGKPTILFNQYISSNNTDNYINCDGSVSIEYINHPAIYKLYDYRHYNEPCKLIYTFFLDKSDDHGVTFNNYKIDT